MADAPSYPDPSKFLNDEQVDLHGYVSAVHGHDRDDLEGIVRSSEQASALLSEQAFQEHFSDLGQNWYQAIKRENAQQLHGVGPDGLIPQEHYDTKLHADEQTRDVTHRSIVKHTINLLGQVGHDDFSDVDVDSLEEEVLDNVSMSVMRDAKRYFGEVEIDGERTNLQKILQQTIYNHGQGELTLGHLYQQINQYMSKAAQRVPQTVGQTGIALASHHHENKSFAQRVDSLRKAVDGLELPFHDDLDAHVYDQVNPQTLFTLHSTREQGSLSEKLIKDNKLDEYIDASKLYQPD